MEVEKRKYKVRMQGCRSSKQALKIYFIACLHTESYHSIAAIKMVEPLSKDYTHHFIAEDAILNKIHDHPLLHSLTLGSQILFQK